MNGLALCSGIGGLELGVSLVCSDYRTVCHVEGEAYAAATLARRMEDGLLEPAPIWSDLRAFDPGPWRGVVDLVTAGYPCQPFSSAGKRLGSTDPRHLWPDVHRVVRALRPRAVFCENVGAHLSRGFPEVARDMEELGYRVAAGLFTAWAVGAPHIRERLFWLASTDPVCDELRHLAERGSGGAQVAVEGDPEPRNHGSAWGTSSSDTDSRGRNGLRQRRWTLETDAQRDGEEGVMADAEGIRSSSLGAKSCKPRGAKGTRGGGSHPRPTDWWATEPDVGRVAHGVPSRVDRLRALGNAVVPAVAARAFTVLAEEIVR